MINIPVLTVRQPYANLIIDGVKDVENRARPTRHRGLVAIHAGRQPHPDAPALAEIGHPDTLPRGVVLGLVELVDCVEPGGFESPWTVDGHWHWVIRNPVRLERPIPLVGQLGLFNPPPAVAARLARMARGT